MMQTQGMMMQTQGMDRLHYSIQKLTKKKIKEDVLNALSFTETENFQPVTVKRTLRSNKCRM